MKKGLSPIISAVLLIALVFVVAGIVFMWVRYTVKNSGEEALELQLCSEINFLADDFCFDTLSVQNIDTGEITSETRIKFNGMNNVLESQLEGFMFSIDYGGTIISISTLPYSELEGGEAKTLFTDVIDNAENIREIKVIPRIKENNRIIICTENDKPIPGGELEEC